jgi:hypothetical protein
MKEKSRKASASVLSSLSRGYEMSDQCEMMAPCASSMSMSAPPPPPAPAAVATAGVIGEYFFATVAQCVCADCSV